MSKVRTIRAFIALKLPADILDRAALLQDALKARGLKLRWVKPRNLHLTLKFLGDIPRSDASAVGSALDKALLNHPPLELTLQGMGVFPGIKRPRVLWLGLGGQIDALRQVHHKLEQALEEIGYRRDKRGFKAHLTIARIKGAVAPETILSAIDAEGSFTPVAFAARRMVLYQSDLRPQGAIYTPLAEVTLGQPLSPPRAGGD